MVVTWVFVIDTLLVLFLTFQRSVLLGQFATTCRGQIKEHVSFISERPRKFSDLLFVIAKPLSAINQERLSTGFDCPPSRPFPGPEKPACRETCGSPGACLPFPLSPNFQRIAVPVHSAVFAPVAHPHQAASIIGLAHRMTVGVRPACSVLLL